MPASSADQRARVQQTRTKAIAALPEPVANGLRRAKRYFTGGGQPSNELENLRATMAAAVATNEAGVVGLSQELARLAEQAAELQARQDELTALLHEQAALIAALQAGDAGPALD